VKKVSLWVPHCTLGRCRFLRFRLGDLVTRGASGSILARIQGRVADRFVLPDGRSIHPYTLVNPLLNQAPWLRQYQIIQERADRIRVKLVPVPDMNPEPEAIAALGRILASASGVGVGVDVEMVDRIWPAPTASSAPTIGPDRAVSLPCRPSVPMGADARPAHCTRVASSSRACPFHSR